jgi:predicted nuclease with TOPRIM domain
MVSFILSPSVFFGVLLGLFVVSMFVAFSILREDSKRKNMDGLLKEERTAKNELQKNVENLQQEIERLKKELSFKDELYRGLKGQYDELERDVERLTIQSQSAGPSLPKTENPAPKTSIVDLLKSLKKIENT